MVTYDARPSAFTQLTTTADWEALLSSAFPTAIDASVGSAMTPTLDTSGRNAVIADGNITIKGQLWRCDAPVSTPIPAASAQNRIDRLVIRLTRGATTSATVVQPAVVTGTPSGTPTIPALTQTPTGIWEYPVSHWTSSSAGAISGLIDDRLLANDTWHDLRPLQNSFVGPAAGNYPPQYKFAPDCLFVEVAGWLRTPATTGNYNASPFATVPPAYRPSQGSHTWLLTGIADSAASPKIQVDSSGNLAYNFASGTLAQTQFGIYGRYPLDSSGLILS
jgi:hypothetical protein